MASNIIFPNVSSRDLPLIIAHRGFHKQFPENSFEAFAAAWEAGFDWVELDLWASCDGEIVTFHDHTLHRTSNGNGEVRHKSRHSLRRLRLKTEQGELTDCRIPLLKHVVRDSPDWLGLLVEFKTKNDRHLVRQTVKLLRGRRCVLQSFHEENLHLIRQIDPTIPLALLIDQPEQVDGALAGPWPAIHMNHYLVDAALVRKLKRRGKRWGAWTVNTEEHLRRIAALKPDVIITDTPKLARDVLGQPPATSRAISSKNA